MIKSYSIYDRYIHQYGAVPVFASLIKTEADLNKSLGANFKKLILQITNSRFERYLERDYLQA